MKAMRGRVFIAALALLPSSVGAADQPDSWTAYQEPFRIFGTAYYVGSRGLSVVLITSAQGHILIDGGVEGSERRIAAAIETVGFRLQDVKVILNSHAHHDHAGSIAALQKMSGAIVKASPDAAPVLRTGEAGKDDPQFGTIKGFPAVARVETLTDGETVRVGPLALTAHFTPGHSPGGTTWTWKSCLENSVCYDVVYADSMTAVSARGFKYTGKAAEALSRSLDKLAALPCNIMLTPHPEASELWSRLERRTAGEADTLVSPPACRRYIQNAREMLAQRLAGEAAK